MVKRKTKQEKKNFEDVIGFWNIFQNEKFCFSIGVLVFAIAVFIILSFFSFFSNGDADQTLIEHAKSGEMASSGSSFKNICGPIGAYTAYFFIKQCFGIAAFIIPFFLLLTSLKLMKIHDYNLLKWFFCTMLVMVITSMTMARFLTPSFIDSGFNPGGEHGLFASNWVENYIGTPGLVIFLVCTTITFLTYLTMETIYMVRKILNPIGYITNRIPFEVIDSSSKDEPSENQESNENDAEEEQPVSDSPEEQVATLTDTETTALETEDHQDNHTENDTEDKPSDNNEEEASVALEINEVETEDKADGQNLVDTEEDEMAPYDPKRDLENYHYPTLDLLKKYDNDGKPFINMDEQNANKDKIISALRNFGVEISSIKATVGPTITLYEITPAVGVRIAKIRNLEDDIALSLAALGIRIIAPIPGKGTIGIEVPNKNPNIVSMESILNSKKFQESTMELPCALGKTITNEVFMFDLAKIPHLLVAGATGQGKSVGLNAILTSLLYKKHPAEMKIVLVDPKKVEFSIYSPIVNHFLAQIPDENEDPIITDVTKVVRTLNSLCKEMDTRYDLLKMAGARNVKEYNKKFTSRMLNPEKGHHYMPYIVVVVDEFGDLIMTAGKEIELPIARIAQLARAVGIHMIIATQRPTTNIITGTIKANFPGRLAFRVSAMVDSKTILDRPGANQLIGRGDLLFLQGNEPVRVQCAFVDTPEVERINEFIGKQQSYGGPFELPMPDIDNGDATNESDGIDIKSLDTLFDDAARLVVLSDSGSTSLIQRKFSIGYNRAGRLMDQLERAGVVGSASGSKPREVLIKDEVSLNNLLAALHR